MRGGGGGVGILMESCPSISFQRFSEGWGRHPNYRRFQLTLAARVPKLVRNFRSLQQTWAIWLCSCHWSCESWKRIWEVCCKLWSKVWNWISWKHRYKWFNPARKPLLNTDRKRIADYCVKVKDQHKDVKYLAVHAFQVLLIKQHLFRDLFAAKTHDIIDNVHTFYLSFVSSDFQ